MNQHTNYIKLKFGKFLLFSLFPLFSLGQGPITLGPTGGSQFYTVPACTDNISIVLSGAGGGGPNGGSGAVLNLDLDVEPGDIIEIVVGSSATGTAGGYPNGGNGQNANTAANGSFGGGGSSSVYVNGVLVAVAGGGGGTGGGTQDAGAANGGCITGQNNAGTPFGVGGGNGSQTAGGTGGPPWTSSGNAGQAGSYLQGGNGATDPCYNNSPGGGGGGGYYGGGGGGSDCFGSAPYGGGGGGGGSSYNPNGDPCFPGQNSGNGSAVITPSIGISASNTGPFCQGATIQLNATSGATAYEWTGPNGFTSNLQNPTIPNAGTAHAGTYSVVGLGSGCDDPATTTVVVIPMPTPNAGSDVVGCVNSYISLSGSVSSSSNTHAWTHLAPGASVNYNPNNTFLSPAVMVNQPGVYPFILTETSGACVGRDTVMVTVSNTTHTTTWTGPSCPGLSNGTITIINPNAVDYSFDGGTTWTSNATQGGFPVGTYTVRSRNQHGCYFQSTVTITEPDQLYIFAGNDTLICQNGMANLHANTSAPGLPVNYHWSHSSSSDSIVTIGPYTSNQTITVYAEGPGGCLSDTAEILITVRPVLSANISPYDTICPGYPTTIGVTGVTGGLTDYLITWDTGESANGTSMSISANPAQTKIYTATITDACETTPLVLTTEVFVAPLPVPLMSVVEPVICEPAVFEVHNETDTSMTASYVWYFPKSQSAINEPVIFSDTLMQGQYDVQLIVTSPLGCVDSVTRVNFLTVQAKPKANFTWSPNPVLMFNTDVHFQNTSFLDHTYEWLFPGGIPSYSNLERPKVKYPEGELGTYPVTLIVTSELGCTDTLQLPLTVYPEVILYAPNAFTPDGDEYNQGWKVYINGTDIYTFHMQIFNRWGEMIFENHDADVAWDGTYNGKPVETGSYTWKISARDYHNDGKYEWNGIVNVLK